MPSRDGDLSDVLSEVLDEALHRKRTRRTTRRSTAPKAPSLNSMPHLRELLASTGAETAAAHELAKFIHEVIQAELKRTRE